VTHAAYVTVDFEPKSGDFKVYEIRTVAEEIEDPARDISLEEARKLNPNANVGDRLKVLTQPADFGRIAAQTAKQVIIQKIKDAERDNVFDEFKNREGELVSGVVKRVSHGNVIVALGRAEAVLPPREQSPRDSLKPGDRVRAYLLEVDKSPRGPQVVLSRATPELVRSLFDLEVPEIYDGTVELRSVAREAGARTKIAVFSNDPNVDPVGACVGMKGTRVRTIVEELHGEKIDIVRWSEDPVEFCTNALNPADVIDIQVDEASNSILVVVPADQLSLAIGKRGQNARLASRLIGWNIDIRSDEELASAPGEDDLTPRERAEKHLGGIGAPEEEGAETPVVEETDRGATAGPAETMPGAEQEAPAGEEAPRSEEPPQAQSGEDSASAETPGEESGGEVETTSPRSSGDEA
jgi:N utilization substance protein A